MFTFYIFVMLCLFVFILLTKSVISGSKIACFMYTDPLACIWQPWHQWHDNLLLYLRCLVHPSPQHDHEPCFPLEYSASINNRGNIYPTQYTLTTPQSCLDLWSTITCHQCPNCNQHQVITIDLNMRIRNGDQWNVNQLERVRDNTPTMAWTTNYKTPVGLHNVSTSGDPNLLILMYTIFAQNSRDYRYRRDMKRHKRRGAA